jgi:hypothetical protein
MLINNLNIFYFLNEYRISQGHLFICREKKIIALDTL